MTDTYRNHLNQRMRGTAGGVPILPVAQIAGNAARETAARIAQTLANSPVNQYNRFLGSRVIQPGTGPAQTPVQRSEYVPQNVPVGNPAQVTPLPDRRTAPLPAPGAPGKTTGFNENSYNALFNAAFNANYLKDTQSPGAAQLDQTILTDPMYTRLMSQGATADEAYRLVVQDRASRTAEHKRESAMETLGADEGGLDPFGELVVSGGTKAVDYGSYGLEQFMKADEYTLKKSQSAIAWSIYGNVKRMSENGASGDEIVRVLLSDTLMSTIIPVSMQDASPEERQAFIDGFIRAYEQGYTAYAAPVQVPSYAAGSAPPPEVVAEWEPGARAAHEYLADERPWWQRAANDLAEAPFNWAFGPFRGVGTRAAKAGEAIVAGSRTEEGVSAAARFLAGRVIQGAGNVMAVPDVVLNKAADNLVTGAINIGKDVTSLVPGVGRAVQYLGDTPVRIKARSAREDAIDTVKTADRMETTTAITDTGGGEPPFQPSWGNWTPPASSVVPGSTGPGGPIVSPSSAETPDVLGGTERWSLKPKPGGMIDAAARDYPTEYIQARRELESIAHVYENAVDKKRVDPLSDTTLTPGSGTTYGYADDAIYAAEFYADVRDTLIRNGIPVNKLPNIDRGGPRGNPTEQAVRRAIYEPGDDTAKSARSGLYRGGYMSPKPPRSGLRDDIINASLPESTASNVRSPEGSLTVGGVKYTNKGLRAMAPEIRVELADQTIAEQTTRYERSVRVGKARERLLTRFDEDSSTPVGATITNPPPGIDPAPLVPARREPPLTDLDPITAQRMDAEPFAGLAEPLYAGMTLRQVRDAIERQIVASQIRANQLIVEIKAEKVALGLGDAPLYKEGESSAKTKKRPVIEAPSEGPVRGKNKALKPLTSTQVIAKEKELVGLLADYNRYGDLIEGDLRSMANEAAAYAKELDVFPEMLKRPNLALDLLDAIINRVPRHLLLADPITSWGYSGRNILGNVETSALATQGRSIERIYEHLRTAISKKTPLHVQISEDLGLVPSRQLERKAATANDLVLRRGIDADSAMGGGTPTRELAQKLHVDWFARQFDRKRAFDAGMEYAAKTEMAYAPILQGLVLENMAKLADELGTYAFKRSIPFDTAFTKEEFLDLFMKLRKRETNVFSYDDLYTGLYDVALARGVDDLSAKNLAQTGSRKWKFASRQSQLDAISETNRIFPSYRRMTNLDHYITYVSLFHFWPTRTGRLVLEEMIRNPQLYNVWKQTHQGLARMAEEGGYSMSVRMLMYIADSPFGWAMYANPISIFLVTALNPEQPDFPDPEGMTRIGHELKLLREQTGLGPTPFIDAVLNVAGVYGNSFPPNPWPSRTTELAGSAIDIALTQMGHGPGTPIYDNSMAWLRGRGSGIIPGTSNVPYVDQGAYTEDIVGSKVLDNNQVLAGRMSQVDADGNPTPDALAAQMEFALIMEDESNPEHVEASKQVALQQGFTKAINAFSPITVKAKLTTREVMIQASREGRSSATPTPYQEGARAIRSSVVTSPESAVMNALGDQYQAIGTERQHNLASGYNEIMHPENVDPGEVVFIDGVPFSQEQMVLLTEDQRERLADRWVASFDGTDELQAYWDERSAFVTANPEFGSVDEYKKSAYDYTGGIRQFRIDRAKANPNFARALEKQRKFLLEMGTDPSMIDAELDQWAASISGYNAAQGIKGSLYDPEPISTGDQATVDTIRRSVGSGSSTGNEASKDPMEQLADHITSYQEKLRLAIASLRSAGYNLSEADIYSANPMYDSLFAAYGVPSMSEDVRLYLQWSAFNEGADTVDAFIAYMEALGMRQAA